MISIRRLKIRNVHNAFCESFFLDRNFEVIELTLKFPSRRLVQRLRQWKSIWSSGAVLQTAN